jgi:transposase
LDNHFPPNGHWQGLSLGRTTVVWLAFSLSEGDHRLYRVEPWVTAHQRTLSRCLSHAVKPRDLTEDRLATVLDSLYVPERWRAFERELNQAVRRVYDVQGRVVRVDTTTAAYVTPEGMFQLGQSKDHRPDLPQVQSARSVLDPLGLPWTTTVVAGHTADDPLSLPEMATVRQTAPRTGLPYVGDCKMAALGTRVEIVAHQDYSVCPLSAKQRPEAARDRVRAPVFCDALKPSALRVPNADGAIVETDDPVARGFASTVERSAPDQSGQARTWPERRLVGRSLACAASQEKS